VGFVVARCKAEAKISRILIMRELEQIKKLAILHCVFQTIASADGGIDEVRDYEAISFALSELGLNSIYSWDAALKLDPHDSFIHIATLSDNDKLKFRELLLAIANMGGNVEVRKTCAQHLFQLCYL
jgi:hypothetical protein